jgi:hypothetical protein
VAGHTIRIAPQDPLGNDERERQRDRERQIEAERETD